jgi:uncharacterized protein YcnI
MTGGPDIGRNRRTAAIPASAHPAWPRARGRAPANGGRRIVGAALACIAAILAARGLALAHAVVVPGASAPGAYERYVLRVPNEKDVPTTRVEITFPAEVRVISLVDVPGWRLETRADSSGRIIAATWTGTLPPERFVELPFMGVNPRAEGRIAWPVYQTYADGERVGWTGPEGSQTPASVTVIGGGATAAQTPRGAGIATWLAAAGLVVGLVALGLVLRPRASPA